MFAQQRNDQLKRVYNPLFSDFHFLYDNGKGGKDEYILKSTQITALPTWLMDKILKQLADQVYWKRYPDASVAYLDEIEKIKRELTVTL